MSQTLMAKKSKGRQKIEMTRMSKESNLLVTFSKRRSGLFKKASELCTLCGAEIAIVVFSPGKKAFSFGHPSVEAIADRFLYQNTMNGSTSSAMSELVEAHRNANVHELNLQLTEVTNMLEEEKKMGDNLTNIRKNPTNESRWWEAPIDELSAEQLMQLKSAMEELKKNIAKQREKLCMLETSNPYFANSATRSFYASPGFVGPSTSINGLVGPMSEVKVLGAGVSMTPNAHGFGIGYGYGNGHGHGHEHGPGYF